MGWRIRGTIQVHELDLTLTFVFEGKTFEESGKPVLLGYDLEVSDAEYSVAAGIIAREMQRPVEWQDIGGNKHLVRPEDAVMVFQSLIDPRHAVAPPRRLLN